MSKQAQFFRASGNCFIVTRVREAGL